MAYKITTSRTGNWGAAESLAFNTLLIMGQASSVSLGVPADSFSIGSHQQLQVREQRKRINAMLQDYELQRRLHSEQQFE